MLSNGAGTMSGSGGRFNPAEMMTGLAVGGVIGQNQVSLRHSTYPSTACWATRICRPPWCTWILWPSRNGWPCCAGCGCTLCLKIFY